MTQAKILLHQMNNMVYICEDTVCSYCRQNPPPFFVKHLTLNILHLIPVIDGWSKLMRAGISSKVNPRNVRYLYLNSLPFYFFRNCNNREAWVSLYKCQQPINCFLVLWWIWRREVRRLRKTFVCRLLSTFWTKERNIPSLEIPLQ